MLADMQPNSFLDSKQGIITGFQVDLLNAIAHRCGYHVDYIAVNGWGTIDSLLMHGMVDVCPVLSINEQRKAFVAFTKSVETFNISVAVRKNSSGIKNVNDLHGKNIGIIAKSQALPYAIKFSASALREYESFYTALYALLAGHIDAFIAPNTVIRYMVNEIQVDDRIELVQPPLAEIKRGMGLSLSRIALRDSFNLEINNLMNSGEYQRLYDKWFTKLSPILTVRQLIVAFLLLLIIVVVIMAAWRYRSLSLKHRELQENVKKREAAEALAKRSMEELQKTQRLESLGVLAGGLAHDFNNLLSGIFGYIDLAFRRARTNAPEVAEPLQKCLSVFGRAKDLTQQLLTFSKGGAPAKGVVDVASLIAQVERMSLGGSTISCERIIPADLAKVSGDFGQLYQVFSNILINSRQAMKDGGRIIIVCKNVVIDNASFVDISVHDNGEGIPKSILEKIFDPFFTTKQGGTGLGLAMAFSIVKKHGGQLTVLSEVGKGTTMRIVLPTA